MNSLPVETFQLVCSYCSLHVLANLRLVSREFRDLVDGSLTARRAFATPSNVIAPRSEHDPTACYIRIALNRQHSPITAIFDRYDPQHNYLEFVQSAPAAIEHSGFSPSAQGEAVTPRAPSPYNDSTLGRLDLNLWEQQQQERAVATATASDAPEGPSPGSVQRPRSSSIAPASFIRGTEQQIQNELTSSGPVTPLSQIRPIRHAQTSSFGMSSPPSSNLIGPGTISAGLPRDAANQSSSENYMTRFARMVLGTTGTGPQASQTMPGMSATQLIEEARQLIHTVESDIRTSKKQYKFLLTEGVHHVGDNGFIMRYTISQGASVPKKLLFTVNFIRVSWKWVSSGVLTNYTATTTDLMTLEDPFPDQRLGRMYASRYNQLLREIKKRELDHYVRGELALDGYDVTLLPRDFISVNLVSAPVLAWITGWHQKNRRGHQQTAKAAPNELKANVEEDGHEKEKVDGENDSEAEWEEVTPYSKLGKAIGEATIDKGMEKSKEDDEDRNALDNLLQSMKQQLGFLNSRNILEEMLAMQGYPRELVWKYGIVRREMMGSVPEVAQARQLLQKIINSENNSNKRSVQHAP
ncbi:hypothetical protein BX616_009722 [Lobosporangium transversale]|uniref:F-box domain-containing protein n=1 Tax=Lobosporangium transversale TaxID=64571 RepID=A0A1Y2H2C1_9FUNG|nr:hypothetical protein BCR41DRAFT_344746 [Lobosporangium transversale]KAF9918259.1 hypothetical protein BX616_009722 [Lobosporangium transversale]ORZ28164.1 hypothetical protein BCR41DRAFT_344746 [Lobosporangium transversale]|eukprot:XP_021885849.1 hypothetical protein BCR41DRAFT_344746 [Lobosporangium transversale]